jgi:hypothetical protein
MKQGVLLRVAVLLLACMAGLCGCVSFRRASRRLNCTVPPSFLYLSGDPKVSVGALASTPLETIDPVAPILDITTCEMKPDIDVSSGQNFPEWPSSSWIRLGSKRLSNVDGLRLVQNLRALRTLAYWAEVKVETRKLERLNNARTTYDFLADHRAMSDAQRAALLTPCISAQGKDQLFLIPQLLTGYLHIVLRSFWGCRVDISKNLKKPDIQVLLTDFVWDKQSKEMVSKARWSIARVSQPLLLELDAYICNADLTTHQCKSPLHSYVPSVQ